MMFNAAMRPTELPHPTQFKRSFERGMHAS
jgi:hypothetical protein